MVRKGTAAFSFICELIITEQYLYPPHVLVTFRSSFFVFCSHNTDVPVVSSRLEWPKDHYFPPCVLRFRDGWEPPALSTLTPGREQDQTEPAESLVNSDGQRSNDPRLRLVQEVQLQRWHVALR